MFRHERKAAIKALCLLALLAGWATTSAMPARAAGPARETIAPAFSAAIPNVPGKSIVGFVVDYPPGASTPPHHHAKSAFVTAYVLSGAIRSQVDDGNVEIFKAGESWTEAPGAHHTISANASKTLPARLLAIFVVDSGDKELTTFDAP